MLPKSSLSANGSEDDRESSSDSEAAPSKHFAFPELDATIRQAIKKYGGAVFPKLNWTAPKDAAWILTPATPLRCTSPADVYLFLKSSDFAAHDLDAEMVFDGCVDVVQPTADDPGYSLELVLKRWYALDQSREVRCFVWDNILIGISQRDSNFYDYLLDSDTQGTIRDAVSRLWRKKIKGNFPGGNSYVVDLLLTRALDSGHIVDFNPYAPRTDSLLFTYPELRTLFDAARQDPDSWMPALRVITSASHPMASRNAPAHQHNMVPREALELSQGRNVEEFRESWMQEISKAMGADGGSNDQSLQSARSSP